MGVCLRQLLVGKYWGREWSLRLQLTYMLRDNYPKHVAIIMDGNRRWAKKRGLGGVLGHKKVVEERVEELIEAAAENGVEYITFWAFSTENWNRSATEVRAILELFRWAIKNRGDRLLERGARLKMIGDLGAFPDDIRSEFEQLMDRSKENERIVVTFALNYGGRDELMRAVKKMILDVLEQANLDGKGAEAVNKLASMTSQELGEKFESYLDTVGMPDPDLIIRTSGELRMSGFMPWQGVYSEYYFTKVLMPDFGKKEFVEALEDYAKRIRRFGAG